MKTLFVKYIRKFAFYLLKKVGVMEVDFYILENGNWIFLRVQTLSYDIHIGEQIELLVDGENKIFEIKSVIHRPGRNIIVRIG